MRYFFLFSSVYLLLILSINVKSQSVLINEFIASNASFHADEDGDFSDWLELFNPTGTAQNLNGFGLSDDTLMPYKWTFPNISIGANQYLIIYLSGKDRATPGSALHTNWSLSSNGEPLILTNSMGQVLDLIMPLYLPTNVSYGRYPNGGIAFNYFTIPTPNSANSSPGFPELLEAPIFSHEAGFYTDSFYLKIHHLDPQVVIRYTLNGDLPKSTSPVFPDSMLIYNRKHDPNDLSDVPTTSPTVPTWHRWYPPLDTVFKGTNIRVKLFKNNALSPEVYTKSYFIDDSIHTRYNLPIVSISIEKTALFGSSGIYTNFNARGIAWERKMHLEYFEPDGHLGFATDAGVRIHGAGTRKIPNKSLRVYFRNSYGLSKLNYSIFNGLGYNEHERLILRTGGSDWARTYFRDAFTQSIMKHFSTVETQAYRPAIMFINSEYWGVVNIRERYDDEYIRIKYGYENIDVLENTGQVVYGSNSHYNALISFLQNNTLSDSANYAHVASKIEIDDFRDYHILQIFSMNVDQPGKNVLFWRPQIPEGKWRWMWYDLDDVFIFNPHCNYDRNGLIYCSGLDSIDAPQVNPKSPPPTYAPNTPTATFLLRALLKAPAFQHNFINRFADMLNTAFMPQYLNTLIDSFDNTINNYMYEHYRRWLRPVPSDYSFHIDNLKLFSAERPSYMRSHINNFFHLDGQFVLDLDVSSPAHGFIKINTIDIVKDAPGFDTIPYPWQGIYFKGVPIQLTATPFPGYFFSHWIGVNDTTHTFIQAFNLDTVYIKAMFMPDTLLYQDSTIIHYWHFNELGSGNLIEIPSDTSTFDTGVLDYVGNGLGYMDIVNDGTDLNLYCNENEGLGLRVRNPSSDKRLVFYTPTIGFKNIIFKYVSKRTENGAQKQVVQYLTSSDDIWKNIGDTFDLTTEYQTYIFDLTNIPEANNNPGFKIRIQFLGNNTDTTVGNNRFDNVVLLGTPIRCSKEIAYYFHFNNISNGVIQEITSNYSYANTDAHISYEGSGIGYMDGVSDGSFVNIHFNESDGKALRVRNPSHTRALILKLPTINLFDVAFEYVTKRTTYGAHMQKLYYRTDSTHTWQALGDTVIVENYYRHLFFDLSSIEAANNNPNFQIKIEFLGSYADTNTGNNRFDNFVLYGNILTVDSIDDGFCLGSYYNFHNQIITQAGTYFHRLKDNWGCDSLAIILSLHNMTSNDTIYENACGYYTSSSGLYHWTETGIYNDTLTNTFGCDSIITYNLVFHTLDTGIQIVHNTLTANDSLATYSWLDCDNNFLPIYGATHQSFIPVFNSYYAVELSLFNCKDTSACIPFFSVNQKDATFFDEIIVYPNPNEGYFDIMHGIIKEKTEVVIYNALGHIVFSSFLSASQKTTFFLSLNKGIYILNLKNSGFNKTSKLIIN